MIRDGHHRQVRKHTLQGVHGIWENGAMGYCLSRASCVQLHSTHACRRTRTHQRTNSPIRITGYNGLCVF